MRNGIARKTKRRYSRSGPAKYGHGGFAEDVIMASTECPIWSLNTPASDNTNAGLFLAASRSVNGKGTRTTVKRSKPTVCLFVSFGCPLTQGCFNGAEIVDVKGLDPAHHRDTSRIHLPGNQIAWRHVERSTYFLWNGGLPLGCDFGNSEHERPQSERITFLQVVQCSAGVRAEANTTPKAPCHPCSTPMHQQRAICSATSTPKAVHRTVCGSSAQIVTGCLMAGTSANFGVKI